MAKDQTLDSVNHLSAFGIGNTPSGVPRTEKVFEWNVGALATVMRDPPLPAGVTPKEIDALILKVELGNFNVRFYGLPDSRWNDEAIKEAIKVRSKGQVEFKETTP